MPLRLFRAYLSANPTDIRVLREVADHEVFPRGIRETVWDDARLIKGPSELVHTEENTLLSGRNQKKVAVQSGSPTTVVKASQI